MRRIDAAQGIFGCDEGEEITIEFESENTICSVIPRFNPVVPNGLEDTGINANTLTFTATEKTRLTIEFHFSGGAGGAYECGFSTVDNDSDGVHHEIVANNFGEAKILRRFIFKQNS